MAFIAFDSIKNHSKTFVLKLILFMGDLQESKGYDGHKCYAKTGGVGS